MWNSWAKTQHYNLSTHANSNITTTSPYNNCTYTLTHTHPFNGPLSRTTWIGRYQKGKTSRDFLLKQETVSGSGISWAICKSAPCSKQIITPAPHHSCRQLYEKTSAMQRLTSFVVSCSSVSVMRTFGMVLTLPLRGLIIYALYTDPADTDRT